MTTATRLMNHSIGAYLTAGLIAGVVAAVVAIIYFLIYTQVADYNFEQISLVSVTMASIIPALLGSLVLYGLRQFSARGTQIFLIGGAVFALLSIVPNFIAPPEAGAKFFWLSSPLHLIVAAVMLPCRDWLNRIAEVKITPSLRARI